MIVQIYSLTRPEDVRALVDIGVDHLGFAVGDQGVPAEISVDRARDLFSLVPERHRTVALSVEPSSDDVAEMARTIEPDIVHVCSDTNSIAPGEQRRLRERLPPGTALMKAIEVGTGTALADARRFEPVSDYLILDTATGDVPGVGASGESHDWSVSREVVAAVDAPVVLAGGLGPDNVAEAVRTVRPAGVDSYTRTSASERRKDVDRVRAFADAARRAARGGARG